MADDLTLLTPNLASLGWDAELDAWADGLTQTNSSRSASSRTDNEDRENNLDAPVVSKGRIARSSRGFCLVFTGGDAVMAASSSARTTTGFAPSTGDFVTVIDHPEDGPSIGNTAPRRTTLTRRAPGRVPEPQVLATNIDDVFVMHGLDRPLNLRRIERQLVIAWDSGANPVIVLTKADEVNHEAEAVASVRLAAPDVEIITTSTVTGQNLDVIRQHFTGTRTIALIGLSGIGKSTLVNALSDGVVQRTGEVRAKDHRGRHTTVTRDLIPLPGGGIVIDTPGIREIGLWQSRMGLAKTFPEIDEATSSCRFADCDHQAEPGCGVVAAVMDGLIARRRLDHWKDLQAELELQDGQLEDFARRAESRSRAGAQGRRDGERRTKGKPTGSKSKSRHPRSRKGHGKR